MTRLEVGHLRADHCPARPCQNAVKPAGKTWRLKVELFDNDMGRALHRDHPVQNPTDRGLEKAAERRHPGGIPPRPVRLDPLLLQSAGERVDACHKSGR